MFHVDYSIDTGMISGEVNARCKEKIVFTKCESCLPIACYTCNQCSQGTFVFCLVVNAPGKTECIDDIELL